MGSRTYAVPDVSCQHCVAAITEEVGKVAGVVEVVVDLPGKTVTVRDDGSATDAAIRAGIAEAGYDVAA